jgi:hypothetical protein
MDVYFTKGPRGSLLPLDDEQAELLERIPQSALIKVAVTQVRNPKFHRKYFALMGYAYAMWQDTQPAREYRGNPVVTSFDGFRDDVTILSGHSEAVFGVTGELRLQAKSISFAKMDELDFERFYSNTINVLLQKVLHNDRLTPEKMRAYVDQVISFS